VFFSLFQLSKLLADAPDFGLPENMAYHRDVRLFTLFVQERHGNPFRKAALSALLAKTEEEDEEEEVDTAEVKQKSSDKAKTERSRTDSTAGRTLSHQQNGFIVIFSVLL
jgi:hypothetical protein